MSLVVFVLLAALAAVAIAYPLLTPPPAQAQSEAPMTDAQVEGAVRRLRQARKRSAQAEPSSANACPVCATPYQAGDRFCVRCGQTLPQPETAAVPAPRAACPSCGAALRAEDLFCGRCGYRLSTPAGSATGGESREEVQP